MTKKESLAYNVPFFKFRTGKVIKKSFKQFHGKHSKRGTRRDDHPFYDNAHTHRFSRQQRKQKSRNKKNGFGGPITLIVFKLSVNFGIEFISSQSIVPLVLWVLQKRIFSRIKIQSVDGEIIREPGKQRSIK